MKFNNQQIKAIENIYDNILLIAGPGTGKTTVLIEKIRYLLKNGYNEKDILAITFTKKASKEMKERLKNENVNIATFDSFCYNLIKNEYEFKIYEDNKLFSKEEMLSFNLYDANLKKDRKPFKYEIYVKEKLENKLYDFNDIEYRALNKIKREKITYKYILIDEFQDTNLLQFEILKELSNEKTKIFAVGDPNQSIYNFRGSYRHIITKYIKIFNAKIKYLTINYRSKNNIVELFNLFIKKNKEILNKKIVANKKNNGYISIKKYKNNNSEIKEVIKKIEDTKNIYKTAILYRNRIQGIMFKNYFKDKYIKPNIMTIHEAKGLEFETVFLIGVNKKIFPNEKLNSLDQLKEERRLMYVAMSRAKKNLYISYVKKSIFIKELKVK